MKKKIPEIMNEKLCWFDLLDVFKKIPINIKDNYSFGLKNIAKTMYKHNLIKKKYEMKYFGNKITKLTEKQKIKLKELFNKSIKFSKKTNIGLDLKSDNLYWDKDKKEWILIDCGPRWEYKPFGFSLDLLNKKKKEKPFQKYLKIWRQSEP